MPRIKECPIQEGPIMTKRLIHVAILLGTQIAFSMSTLADEALSPNWPQFRGEYARGTTGEQELPMRWDVPKNSGVLWKTPIEGLGHSSPIIWGDHLYVTTAVSAEGKPELKVGLYGDGDSAQDMGQQRWLLICLDKRTGKVEWQREGHKAKPSVARHTKATHCNSTPATNGKFIVTFFGAEGLFCFDMSGKPVWKKDLGRLEGGPLEFDTMEWGFASSPIIEEDKVIVQCDVHDQAFVAAFDVSDGKELWRTTREEVPTWGTPTVYTAGNKKRIAVNGFRHIGGYDLNTGGEVWKLVGGGDVPVPTPIWGDGLLYIANAHGETSPLYAIHCDIEGEVSAEENSPRSPAWSEHYNGAYMQTPILYRGLLYSCNDRGVVKCYDAKSGKLHFEERLGKGLSGFTSSPVAGGGNVYFTSEEGEVYAVRAGKEFRVRSVNPLGETTLASPAISDRVIYFRTRGHIVAIGG
jgi:outer membrane protein assembly factor BamB